MFASGCRCGKRLFSGGTCVWCGHGLAAGSAVQAYDLADRPVRQPLPRNLGALHRAGLRPNPRLFLNVRTVRR